MEKNKREDDFKKGIADKTQDRLESSIRKSKIDRYSKLSRMRYENPTVNALNKVKSLWNPTLFLQGDPVQLDVLKTMMTEMTSDDMTRFGPQILPIDQAGVLVDMMRATTDSMHIQNLAATLFGILSHSTPHDPLYSQVITKAGYFAVAMHHMQQMPNDDGLHSALWSVFVNISACSKAAAEDVLKSQVFACMPHEMQRWARHPSMAVAMTWLIHSMMDSACHFPHDVLITLWTRLLDFCKLIQPVLSWKSDLDPLHQQLVRELVCTTRLLFCKYHLPDNRIHLFDSPEAMKSWLRFLIHFTALPDAPIQLREVALNTLVSFSTTVLDFIPPLLFECGVVECIMKCIETPIRANVFLLMANVCGYGVLAAKQFTDRGALRIIAHTIGHSDSTTRKNALFTLRNIVFVAVGETAQTVEANALLMDVIQTNRTLRFIPLMLNPEYGLVVMIDALELVEAVLKWNRSVSLRYVEDYGIDDIVEKLHVYPNSRIVHLSTSITDLISDQTCEMREAEYAQAAQGFFSF